MVNIFITVIHLVLLMVPSVLVAQDSMDKSKKNTFIIDQKTTISFTVPNNKYYFSAEVDGSVNIIDVNNVDFVPFQDFAGF